MIGVSLRLLAGLYLVIFVTTSSQAVNVADPAAKTVFVGDSFDLNLPGVNRVRMSREGVVYVRPAGGDIWRFTGIAKGVVIMHPESENASDNKKKQYSTGLVIEVRARPAAARPRVLRRGDGSDTFGANRRALHEKIERLCEGSIDRYDVFEFVISMQSVKNGQSTGMAGQLDLEVNGGFSAAPVSSTARRIPPGLTADLVSRLVDKTAVLKSKILARPRIALVPGKQLSIRSGGEFRVDVPVYADLPRHAKSEGIFSGSIGSWKEYGINIVAIWSECFEGAAGVEYDITLSQRVGGGNEALSSGRITGMRHLPVDSFVFGGAIDFVSGSTFAGGTSLFSQVPILGPLLKRSDKESGNSEITVWIRGLSKSDEEQPELYIPGNKQASH